MSIPITFNGVEYDIPEFRDTNYANELTQFFVAIPNGSLQPTGGLFTLLSEVDFGASYGLKSLYVKSRATNPAAAGIFRLGNTETVSWRNAAHDGDLALTVNASDQLAFNSTKVLLSGAVVNADINASAAIAYSKLNLASSIVNADISGSASIALAKLAALTASRALVSDGGGTVSVSAVTATELGYVAGVTSAIQTQLDAKLNLSGGTLTGALGIGGAADASSLLTVTSTTKGLLFPRMTTTQRDAISSPANGLQIYNTSTGQMNVYASGAWAALAASGGGTVNSAPQYQLAYYAVTGTAVSGLTAITASRALASDANGLPVASAVTATELGYVAGVTSGIQSQIDLKAPLANPTFTGTVVIPTPFTLGAVSVTATGTELNYLAGVTSAIQTQLDGKANLALSNLSAVAINTSLLPGTDNSIDAGSTAKNFRSLYVSTSIKNGSTTLATATELGYLTGVSSAIQTQLNLKSPLASPTFTGTVTLPNAAITDASNQLVLGVTRTVTLTAPTPASSSRTITLPDLSGDYSVVGTIGAQTIAGAKSLTSILNVTIDNATNNNITEVLSLGHNTSGTPANGIGTEIDFYAETSTTPDSRLSTIGSLWTDVTHATRTSNLYFQTRNSGTLATALTLTGAGQTQLEAGLVGTPALAFRSDPDTGIFSGGANLMAFATGGVLALYIDGSGCLQYVDGAVGAPSHRFQNDPDTGIYSGGANILAFTTAGVQRLILDATGNIYGTTSGTEMAVKSTYNSVPLNSVGGLSNSITIQNSKTFTVDCSSSKCFLIQMGNGDAALVMTSYLSATITITGSSGIIVASSTPSAGQLGIFKSSSSHTISFKSGSSLTSTANQMQLCFLGNAPSAATNWA